MGTDTPRTDALNTTSLPGAASQAVTQTPKAAGLTIQIRLRDLAQHRNACAAAEGDLVEEIDACAVRQDMTIWFPDPAPGRWMPVKQPHVEGPKTVIDFLVAPPYSSSWTLASDRPVCRRVPQSEVHGVPAA
jgi:hypothetical protein